MGIPLAADLDIGGSAGARATSRSRRNIAGLRGGAGKLQGGVVSLLVEVSEGIAARDVA